MNGGDDPADTPSPRSRGGGRGEGRFRRVLTVALVLIAALALSAAFSPRVRLFLRSLGGAPTTSVLGESRDADYAAFLEGVRRRTPPDAAISLVLPAESKAHVSEAMSRLAPRRVFVGRENEANFVAAYRYQYRDGLSPDVMEIPNGALFRRQVIARE
jgi:hypothetical protein